MRSPLEWFGLPHDADERALKRVYAQRLRTTRPDEDPEGFQQLHSMYQQALTYCRAHPQANADPAIDVAASTSPEHIEPVTATPHTARSEPREPAVPALSAEDVDTLAQAVVAMASQGDTEALHTWLRKRPELWSLQLKHAIGRRCVEHLFQRVPPMPSECLQVILGFFDLDRVRSGLDVAALARLSRRMQLAWELQPAHHQALRDRLGAKNYSSKQLQRLLAESTQPFRWPQVMFAGLLPSSAHQRAHFLARLSQGHLNELPESFDRRRLQFWIDAKQAQTVTRARLALGATRWLLAVLLASLIGGAMMLTQTGEPDPAPLIALLVLSIVPGLIWLVWMLYLPLDAWHGKPEQMSARWPWLNLLMVPLLCLLGVTLKLAQPANYLYLIPMVPAVWLALRRFWRRSWSGGWLSPNVVRVSAFLSVPLLRSVINIDVTCELLATFALAPWLYDIWRHRSVLRVRAERA